MPRIVDVKCPRCGAPLPIQPGVEVVTCQYCGARSLLDRGRGPTRFPQGTMNAEGMHVVRVAPSSSGAPVAVAASAGVADANVLPLSSSGLAAQPRRTNAATVRHCLNRTTIEPLTSGRCVHGTPAQVHSSIIRCGLEKKFVARTPQT